MTQYSDSAAARGALWSAFQKDDAKCNKKGWNGPDFDECWKEECDAEREPDYPGCARKCREYCVDEGRGPERDRQDAGPLWPKGKKPKDPNIDHWEPPSD